MCKRWNKKKQYTLVSQMRQEAQVGFRTAPAQKAFHRLKSRANSTSRPHLARASTPTSYPREQSVGGSMGQNFHVGKRSVIESQPEYLSTKQNILLPPLSQPLRGGQSQLTCKTSPFATPTAKPVIKELQDDETNPALHHSSPRVHVRTSGVQQQGVVGRKSYTGGRLHRENNALQQLYQNIPRCMAFFHTHTTRKPSAHQHIHISIQLNLPSILCEVLHGIAPCLTLPRVRSRSRVLADRRS